MASTRNPPTAGPAMAPVPTIVIIKPMALPRSFAGKAAMTIAMPVPWVMAAPQPWNILAAIKIVKLEEEPATAAPRTKTREPIIYTLLGPIRSDNRPMGSSKALMVRA